MISARLNPDYPQEAEALRMIDHVLANNKDISPREIITDAILHRNGYTPEMFRNIRSEMVAEEQLMGLHEKLNAIYDMLTNQVVQLLENIRSEDPEGFRQFANREESTGDFELDEQFVHNAKRAARKTFKQKGGR